MANPEKHDDRLVQLPSGDWVMPSDIIGVCARRYKDHGCGITTKPHVTVVTRDCGHIDIYVDSDSNVQPLADRVAAIANTPPAKPDEPHA